MRIQKSKKNLKRPSKWWGCENNSVNSEKRSSYHDVKYLLSIYFIDMIIFILVQFLGI